MFPKIRELSRNLAIYGLGDVAVSVVNFLLLGLFVRYLTAADYGVLGLLGSVEVAAKILFRFGLDGAFMRFFYECEDDDSRQRLASTIFFFLAALNGVLMAALLAASPWLADALLGTRAHTLALRLVIINTFAIGFTFLPFHVLRIERKSVTFSLLTLARSVLTIGVRLWLVVAAGMGVTGVVLADVLVTAALLAVLVRWFAPLIRPMFSRAVLREALRFGMPRVPHAAAQQVMAVADKPIMKVFTSIQDVGVYSMAVSFGLTQKLFLSAFESAWAPFYYATVREPGAPAVFRAVTTYALAVLALLTAGLATVGSDVARAMTHGYFLAPDDPRWATVQSVITWTAVGVLLQGFYLLTSIGLNITKQTRYYPVATAAAAGTNVVLNFAFIPRYGIVGAGWANAAAYGVQAALGYAFSQRYYPIAYEWGRVARVIIFAGVAAVTARTLPRIDVPGLSERSSLAPLPDILVRGLTVVLLFVALLAVSGFFNADEMRRLNRLRLKRREAPAVTPATDTTELAGEIVALETVEEAAERGETAPIRRR